MKKYIKKINIALCGVIAVFAGVSASIAAGTMSAFSIFEYEIPKKLRKE